MMVADHTSPNDHPNEAISAIDLWDDALLSARLLAVDPKGLKGVVLKAKAGPVRDRWLSYFSSLLPEGTPLRRLPAGITDDRLYGGIDLSATLKSGKPVRLKGLLAEADQGFLVAPMAERMSLDHASRLSGALDFGEARLERDGLSAVDCASFGLIALDEGEGESFGETAESLPPALSERLSFFLSLDSFSIRDAVEYAFGAEEVAEARAMLRTVDAGEIVIETLCGLALKLGVFSMRAPVLALKAARAHAALSGRCRIGDEDIIAAVRLVLAPRATMWPSPEEDYEEESIEAEPDRPDDQHEENQERPESDTIGPIDDLVLEAVKAGLPPGLLAAIKAHSERARSKGERGKQGSDQFSNTHGRPLSARRGDLRAGRKLDVIATLRKAAPFQALRAREKGVDGQRATKQTRRRLYVRPEDFQITRFKDRKETATIFAVDASGSTAIARLGEAKGAVELLLSESYARRDHVALISFRGEKADLLLSPTRSLVRAKRALAALPGGGGTPLASALSTSIGVVEDAERRGRTPTFVLLTDGSANIALDGSAGRKHAFDDALGVARQFGALGTKALIVDISKRKSAKAQEIASAMNGLYVPLPHINAEALSSAVRALA
ncbi:MAG: magnesium chelatase subunit D [Pseudomonadota bacterium]